MKAIFIDRDGTIGGSDEVTFPNDFKLYPFSQIAINILKEHEYLVFAFTNQPDISMGKVDYQDFENELCSIGFNDIYSGSIVKTKKEADFNEPDILR